MSERQAFWRHNILFSVQRTVQLRRIVMFRKLSVFLNSQLKRRLENDPRLARRMAVQSALRFPGDLVRECLIDSWGLFEQPTSLSSYVSGKLFYRGDSENNRLRDFFVRSSRIEATISSAIDERCMNVDVLFFPSGRNGRMYKIHALFDFVGKGHVICTEH